MLALKLRPPPRACLDTHPEVLAEALQEGVNLAVWQRKPGREEVKRLLVEPSQDIETIANHVGYTSASSLIRSFRQEIGMSPGKYREQKHTARN